MVDILSADILDYLKSLKKKGELEGISNQYLNDELDRHLEKESANMVKMDLVMTVEFEMEKKRDPFYEIFLTAANRNSYKLIRYFYPYY